jgi:histidine ammonia-lyase
MITQYTAAALATENKVLAHPASADTIPTSANVEDHVSMGCTAALKTRQIVNNVENILALELMAAAQAIDFRKQEAAQPQRLGQGTQPAYDLIRSQVPFVEEDQILYPYIRSVRDLVASGELVKAVNEKVEDIWEPEI